MIVLAIDLGATNIKAALIEDGQIISEKKSFPTNASGGKTSILNSLYQTIDSLFTDKVEYFAVSSAGDIDKTTQTITYATNNLPGVIGYNFEEDLYQKYKRHTFAVNDGEAAILGEMTYGIGKAYQNKKVLMLTLGTGIGSAIYENHQIISTKYGHITIIDNGKECTCGKKGCAESYLSANALIREINRLQLDKENFFKEVLNKNNAYVNLFQDYLKMFKTFLQEIKKEFKFDLLIIGGGMTSWMGDAFQTLWGYLNEPIVCASLFNDAGFLGAYANLLTKIYNIKYENNKM